MMLAIIFEFSLDKACIDYLPLLIDHKLVLKKYMFLIKIKYYTFKQVCYT